MADPITLDDKRGWHRARLVLATLPARDKARVFTPSEHLQMAESSMYKIGIGIGIGDEREGES